MEEMDRYRLFDAYLRGELSDEEMEEFTGSLESDPDLEAEFETHKSIISGIRESRRKELKEFLDSRTKMHKGFFANGWGKPFLYASAAVIVIFVATFFVIEYYLPEEKSITEALKKAQPKKVNEKPERQSIQEIPSSPQESLSLDAPPVAEYDVSGETEEIELSDHTAEVIPDSLDVPVPPAENSVSRAKEETDDYIDMAEQEEEEENSYPVLKDSKYADTVLFVQYISSQANAIPEKKSKSMGSDSSRFRDSSQVKKADINRLPAKKIKIEFWDSPVDYKGYKFNGNLLLLYGFSTPNVQLKALPKNEQLNIWEYFLQSGNKVYELVESENFRTYKEVTDQSLLQRIGK